MNPKPHLTIAVMAIILICISVLIKCGAEHKSNKILKENDKEILVREYNTSIKAAKNMLSLEVKYDSAIYKYKQKEILYDGILTTAHHDPHVVLIKTTKQVQKGNSIYRITKNEHAEEYFSCDQVSEFEKNIGKHIVVTKVYYPRERYFYKFP